MFQLSFLGLSIFPLHGAARRCIICAMRSPSKKKDHRNVLAVFSLRTFVGRDLLAGVLDEMPSKKDWHLDTVRPGRFFTERELVNEDGEPFDGYILSMPGTDAAMRRIAACMHQNYQAGLGYNPPRLFRYFAQFWPQPRSHHPLYE